MPYIYLCNSKNAQNGQMFDNFQVQRFGSDVTGYLKRTLHLYLPQTQDGNFDLFCHKQGRQFEKHHTDRAKSPKLLTPNLFNR